MPGTSRHAVAIPAPVDQNVGYRRLTASRLPFAAVGNEDVLDPVALGVVQVARENW